MIQITTYIGTFGPFNEIVEMEDRYNCDGVHYPFTVIGKGVIEDYVEPVVEPVIIEETTNV